MVTTIHGSFRDSGRPRGGTQEDLRRHNLSAVLTHLHISGPLSRAELTARLQLNRSTIAGLVGELADAGLVRERSPDRAPAGAGRPSLLVEADPCQVRVLAAVVAVDQVDVALVGLGGDVVARRSRALGALPDARDVAAALAAEVAALLGEPATDSSVVGLGVAVAGVVRKADGCVRFAPNLDWRDEPLGEMLRPLVGGRPVQVANDADLGLLAEHRRGAARGVDDAIFLAGDIGVGGGIFVGGRPLVGAGGYAGELGHIVVRPGGRRCRCRARGCWETEIGAPAVARALGLPVRTERARLVAALRELGPGSRDLAEIGRYLGRGMAVVVNMLNPRLLIVGGLLREVYPLVDDEVSAALTEAALAAPAEQLRVSVPALGGDAALIGASELAWDELLADPLVVIRDAGELRRHA